MFKSMEKKKALRTDNIIGERGDRQVGYRISHWAHTWVRVQGKTLK